MGYETVSGRVGIPTVRREVKAPSKMGRKMVFGRGGIRTARNSMKDMTFPLKDIEIFTPKQKYL